MSRNICNLCIDIAQGFLTAHKIERRFLVVSYHRSCHSRENGNPEGWRTTGSYYCRIHRPPVCGAGPRAKRSGSAYCVRGRPPGLPVLSLRRARSVASCDGADEDACPELSKGLPPTIKLRTGSEVERFCLFRFGCRLSRRQESLPDGFMMQLLSG